MVFASAASLLCGQAAHAREDVVLVRFAVLFGFAPGRVNVKAGFPTVIFPGGVVHAGRVVSKTLPSICAAKGWVGDSDGRRGSTRYIGEDRAKHKQRYVKCKK